MILLAYVLVFINIFAIHFFAANASGRSDDIVNATILLSGISMCIIAIICILFPVGKFLRNHIRAYKYFRLTNRKQDFYLKMYPVLDEILEPDESSIKILDAKIQNAQSQIVPQHSLGALIEARTELMASYKENNKVRDNMREVISAELDKMRERNSELLVISTNTRNQTKMILIDNFFEFLLLFVLINVGFGFVYYSLSSLFCTHGIQLFDVASVHNLGIFDWVFYSFTILSTLNHGIAAPIHWLPQLIIILQIGFNSFFILGVLSSLISWWTSDELYRTSCDDINCHEILKNKIGFYEKVDRELQHSLVQQQESKKRLVAMVERSVYTRHKYRDIIYG